MSLARARAAQSLRNGLRQSYARPAAVRSNTFRRAQVEAKRYASSGEGHKSSSDIPWLIGAIVVTVPSCYYLWPTFYSDDDHHGSHGKDDKHGEKKDAEEEESSNESADDKSDDKEESKEKPESDGGDDSKAEDDSSDDKSEDKPAKKGGDSDVEGVTFKGKVKSDSDAAEHTKKSEPDSKGGAGKKRIDSGLRKELGPESAQGDSTSTSSKQDGLNNTQTRHSIPIHEQDDKSKKPDGTPETSKTIGTVDPAKKK